MLGTKCWKWFGVASLAVGLGFASIAGRGAEGDLGKVLRQMDEGAKNFKSAQADLEWDSFQAVVSETDVQKGTVYFERKGNETQMAARFRELNGKPEPKDLVFKGGSLQFYQPKIKQLTVFSAGQNRAQYESFLTLGFGASGSDLERNYDITYDGTETVNGVAAAKLDMKPKLESVKKNFTHVMIWVDPPRAISVKQQFFAPGGDYRTLNYSNIKYNTPLGDDVFTLKTAPGTQIVNK